MSRARRLRERIEERFPENDWPRLHRLMHLTRRSLWRLRTKNAFLLNRDKRRFAARCAALHARLLREKRDKTKLRVVFVTMTASTWKVDPVFRAMLADPGFEPIIAIVPRHSQSPVLVKREMEAAYAHFSALPCPVVMTAGEEAEGRRVIDDLAPDLVFMANPHRLTLPEFYNNIYERNLCFYVPYHYQVGKYDNHIHEYNQYFHNAMWKIFLPHEESMALARKHSANRGANTVLSGYPACENLRHDEGVDEGAWKAQDGPRLRLIWAPHHTIDMPNLPYANFLRYAEAFRDEARRRRDAVQWAFKPHPLLLGKLHAHPEWGPERADEYYAFWRDFPCCQLETGAYRSLFLRSDALIHDSGSFLAEYLHVDKPVMFLQAVDDIRDYFNNFGNAAFDACLHARRFEEVQGFIDDLLAGRDDGAAARRDFLQRHVESLFATPPSARIIAEIKRHFPCLDDGGAGSARRASSARCDKENP